MTDLGVPRREPTNWSQVPAHLWDADYEPASTAPDAVNHYLHAPFVPEPDDSED